MREYKHRSAKLLAEANMRRIVKRMEKAKVSLEDLTDYYKHRYQPHGVKIHQMRNAQARRMERIKNLEDARLAGIAKRTGKTKKAKVAKEEKEA